MTVVILLFGALIALTGIIIMVNPEAIFGLLRTNSDRLELHVMAVLVRLTLGALLIHQSDLSKFPLVIEIIGWVSIVAAVSLAVVGRRNFNRLMSWALAFVSPFGRVGGALATAFGAFVVYAFV